MEKKQYALHNKAHSPRETTVNIRKDILEQLNLVSEKLKISRSQVIARCIRRYVKATSGSLVYLKATQHQEPTRNYICLHVMINPVEYELFFDLRKSLKLSFSLIVRLSLLAFMDELVTPKKSKLKYQEEDEYRLNNYIMCVSQCENVRKYEFTWEEG